jgi:hypothetical protein
MTALLLHNEEEFTKSSKPIIRCLLTTFWKVKKFTWSEFYNIIDMGLEIGYKNSNFLLQTPLLKGLSKVAQQTEIFYLDKYVTPCDLTQSSA